jgi:dolichol kinase
MVSFTIALIILSVILLSGEVLWHKKILRGESARKFIHSSAGAFIATWPFFIDFKIIQIWSVVALAVVFIVRKYGLVKVGYDVKRTSYGELWYLVAVLLAASVTTTPWIFMVAILHMALADSLAAVIGKRFGKGNSYEILNATKSVVGTAVFYVVSLVLTGIFLHYNMIQYKHVALGLLFCLPILATAAENFAPYGLDNLLVPGIVAIVLVTTQLKI